MQKLIAGVLAAASVVGAVAVAPAPPPPPPPPHRDRDENPV